jgi:hypothetical protein
MRSVTIRFVRRRIFTLASLLSLILCVGMAALWIAGHWYELWAFKDDGSGGRAVLYSGHGHFNVQVTRWPSSRGWTSGAQRSDSAGAFTPAIGYTLPATPFVRSFFGVEIINVTGWLNTPADPTLLDTRQTLTVTSINVPIVLPGMLLCVLPLAWLAHSLLQRRRNRAGLCATCNYNLTGNTSGVCPECGTAITSPPAQSSPSVPLK